MLFEEGEDIICIAYNSDNKKEGCRWSNKKLRESSQPKRFTDLGWIDSSGTKSKEGMI